ncbi:hypothetical protein F5Y17DRAFT_463102 [Xylariaceae sp. FL0594]|nr:hypothetical protein F5Y17DRAFT_463102 [Xylariaceae sp. FL0594]
MRSITPLLYVLLPSAISAQEQQHQRSLPPSLPISGPEKAGPGNTPEAISVFETAGRTPNATTSVSFEHPHNGSSEAGWTWRINVTEVAVPDDLSYLGLASPDNSSSLFSQGLRVVNTQWQLGWPRSDNDTSTFESFLLKRNTNASFTSLVITTSKKILESYDEGDNGDCTKVLGSDCAKTLTEAAAKDGLTGQLTALDDACEDVVGKDRSKLHDGIAFVIKGKLPSNSSNSFLTRDDTLLFRTSKTYTTDKKDPENTFQNARSALHIFTMQLTDSQTDPTVLCRVVDKDNASPAVVSWRRPSGAVWGLVVMGMVFAML